jgi:hypothetical protein
MIGCARQRNDSGLNRIEKLKSGGYQLHEFGAENAVALKVTLETQKISEQGKKIALFFIAHSVRLCVIIIVHL